MSYDLRTKAGTPSTPAATKYALYFDSADGRYKYVDENGFVRTLTSVEWPKNHLINGGWNFAQRQAPGTLTSRTPGTAARAYGADRWFVANEANDTQYQRIDTIAAPESGVSHRFYGRWKKVTAVGKILVGQIMSAENSAVLRGKRVRVNLKMKRTVAAGMTVRLGLAQLTAAGTHDTVPGFVNGAPSGTFVSAWGSAGTDPTLGTNVSRLTPVTGSADGGTIAGAGMNCVLTGTHGRFSVAFDVPSDAKNVIFMVWTDGQLAVNDELNLSECLLTEGIEIADWVSIPQVQELDRCGRFYQKSFGIDTAPAQNAGLAGAERGHTVAGAVASSFGINFNVVMRAAPGLVTFYNPSAANAFVRNVTAATDATATTSANISDGGFDCNNTGLAAWAAGQPVAVHYSADAEL